MVAEEGRMQLWAEALLLRISQHGLPFSLPSGILILGLSG